MGMPKKDFFGTDEEFHVAFYVWRDSVVSWERAGKKGLMPVELRHVKRRKWPIDVHAFEGSKEDFDRALIAWQNEYNAWQTGAKDKAPPSKPKRLGASPGRPPLADKTVLVNAKVPPTVYAALESMKQPGETISSLIRDILCESLGIKETSASET